VIAISMSFSKNVIGAKTSYKMLGILLFSNRKRAFTSFNGNMHTSFCGEKKKYNEAFQGVYF